MLEQVLKNLVEERGALRSALLVATKVTPRSDFIDCWNLLDEIAEHDRRIETLLKVIAEAEREPAAKT